MNPKRELQLAYKKVDERDGGACQHPGCDRPAAQRHHCEFRSEAPDRVACVENIVSLCEEHHEGRNGPHQQSMWRVHWLEWQKITYPYYMTKAEQDEMVRLSMQRFCKPEVLKRFYELEEKWRIWNENKIPLK